MELVRTEGQKPKPHHAKKKKESKDNTSDPEDEEEGDENEVAADDEEGPLWPGIESLLPPHRHEEPSNDDYA
jgi:hypothetical protein